MVWEYVQGAEIETQIKPYSFTSVMAIENSEPLVNGGVTNM